MAPRRAVIRRLDPLSGLRVSLVFYVCVYLMAVAAGMVVWLVASAVGIIGNLEGFIGDLLALEGFHFVAWKILRIVAVGGAALVVLGAILTLCGALLYNLTSRMVGGLEVTTLEEERVPRGVV